MPANYNPPVTEFLDKEGRANWYNNNVQFLVIEAESRQGEYGLAATYKLARLDDMGEVLEQVYFSVALTDQKSGAAIKRREDELNWFIDTLKETSDHAVGPLVLVQTPTTKGNPAWGFGPPVKKASK